MRQTDALQKFEKLDLDRRRVFLPGDMRKLFPEDSERALEDGLARLVSNKILERPLKGVYVFGNTRHPRDMLIYEIARTLRRGYHTYLSLESACSEYGLISQIPLGHMTFMTTGRRQEFKAIDNSFTIEFTQTTQDPASFITDLRNVGRPLPIASPARAVRDLRRAGRNTHLLQDLDTIPELEAEQDMGVLKAHVKTHPTEEYASAEF